VSEQAFLSAQSREHFPVALPNPHECRFHECGASTYSGYKNIWLRYVRPNGDVALRDVRTFEAEQILKSIARRENLCRTTVARIGLDEPKRPKSKAAIPVIAPLKILLEQHRTKCGNPQHGFIFSNEHRQPMNLEALAAVVIRPLLEQANLCWHGWHAFRRGLATNLHRLGVSDKVIQQILRHANVSTTMNIYVKTVSADAANAMKALEMMCATTVQPARLGSSRVM
jgi:hypothetical protein